MQLDIKKIFLCSNIFFKKKLHIVFFTNEQVEKHLHWEKNLNYRYERKAKTLFCLLLGFDKREVLQNLKLSSSPNCSCGGIG